MARSAQSPTEGNTPAASQPCVEQVVEDLIASFKDIPEAVVQISGAVCKLSDLLFRIEAVQMNLKMMEMNALRDDLFKSHANLVSELSKLREPERTKAQSGKAGSRKSTTAA